MDYVNSALTSSRVALGNDPLALMMVQPIISEPIEEIKQKE